MQSAALLERVMGDSEIYAAAIFGADRSVAHLGFDERILGLTNVAATLRHVFRETTPPVRSLDLRFRSQRLLAAAIDDDLLLVRASLSAQIERLLRTVSEARTEPSAPRAAPSAPVRPPGGLSPTLPFDALALVVEEARLRLGGPVIRNYLRKSRETVPARERLREVEIDLSGRVTPKVVPIQHDPELARAMGAWARAFLQAASVVVPELAALDLRKVTARLGSELDAAGFHEDP
jgi:hypothetical protein